MIASNTPPESTVAFLAGTKYEGYTELMSLSAPDSGLTIAAVVEAPEDVDTATPLTFIYQRDGKIRFELAEGDMLRLAIAVASKWANSDELDVIPEESIAAMLCVISFGRVHPSEARSLFLHVLGIVASKTAEGLIEEADSSTSLSE